MLLWICFFDLFDLNGGELLCAILGVLNMPNYVIWLDYLWSLVFGPDYRHDPVFIKAKEEAFELKDRF